MGLNSRARYCNEKQTNRSPDQNQSPLSGSFWLGCPKFCGLLKKNQELQGEVYSTIARSVNKHTGKVTVIILRDNFLTAFNRRKRGRNLEIFFLSPKICSFSFSFVYSDTISYACPSLSLQSSQNLFFSFLFRILRYDILRLPSSKSSVFKALHLL